MIVARIALLALVSLLTQDVVPKLSEFDRGTHAFRRVLLSAGLKPVENFDELLQDPAKSIVIVFGHAEESDHVIARSSLQTFLRKGGAILVATDSPLPAGLKADLEVTIQGDLLQGPSDSTSIYRGTIRDCPLVKSAMLSPWSHLTRIASNRPSYLRELNAGNRPIANLPERCIFHSTIFPQPLPFAVTRKWEAGRSMVIADHSLFINAMMLQPDNDNIACALATANWLSEGGKRNRVYFFDDGKVQNRFDVDLDSIDTPIPHPDILGPMVDQFIQGVEREDTFNRLFMEKFSIRTLMRTFLLVASAVTACFALYRVTSRKLRVDPQAERLPDRLADLAEPVATTPSDVGLGRELARRAFENWGVTTEPSVTSRQWSREVAGLWAVAQGQQPVNNLTKLAARLSELGRAIEAGEVQLGDRS